MPNTLPSLRRTALALVLALGAAAPALAQQIGPPDSKVNVTFRQMGVPVDASFTKFNGTLQFDPAQPAAASVQFTIDIASFDLGSADYNKEVLKPQWFDAAKFPTARFASSAMKVLSPTQLEVTGQLTLKGKTQEIRFPVTLKESGAQRSFEGVVRIQRTAFQIGTGEWQDTSLVADEVAIKVTVLAPLKKP
jgi:polyisoprenoid-binding protein YceI